VHRLSLLRQQRFLRGREQDGLYGKGILCKEEERKTKHKVERNKVGG
jgi:hypothetical protein